MKVIHNTQGHLVIEDRPWLLGLAMIAMALIFLAGSLMFFSQGEIFGALMMGAVGMGVPLLIAVLMVQRVRLTFDRGTGMVTRTRKSVFGLTQTSYSLHRVSRAVVSVSHGDDGNTYRLELSLSEPAETVPFTTYHTSGGGPARLCDTVNAWLGTEPHLPPIGRPVSVLSNR